MLALSGGCGGSREPGGALLAGSAVPSLSFARSRYPEGILKITIWTPAGGGADGAMRIAVDNV